MICPNCHGSGWQSATDERGPRVCDACGGRCTVYCCEGEQQAEGMEDVWALWQDFGEGG
jgi:hypothetical protein